MADDSPISDDPGTILESYVGAVKKASSPVPAAVPAARGAGPAEEVLYKSPYRWKAPRILICDDDSLDEGETVHVRSDKIVIGRTKGDIVIGHDVAMSSSHAEIARRDYGGKHAWILSDLGSSNGTYVRARSVTLRPGIIILIGSKRFRFDLPYPSQPAGDPQADPGTMLVTDIGSLATDALPALVEVRTPAGAAAARHPFAKTNLKIGRPGRGNDIEIDDLCLAGTHAVVARDYSGVWQLESQPSLNGIWVQVDRIKLPDSCLFQCGEQRVRVQG